ncbi:TRAP transporter large permease subunit [Pararhodobacter aggregans]|uniref:TRAP C4-dicarboxylate transport system permease DctM subunit domain-containing protein n=2 Tax=Pararhodobacter aggregans TaxID=404875 RepID=A0A2T7UV44_9RHOB|nr:TRAP transporter large permease subunit [Pararhodobacter aggregans]PVE48448.1 hypothetical protein DDE23_05135 [Pararhodobacter aggregans]
MTLVAQKMIDGLKNDLLRSLPVLGMATAILGWMRGGLGPVAVGACTIVASISGSGVTTALAMSAHGDVFFGISGLTAGTGNAAFPAARSQSSTADDRGHGPSCHRPCRTGGRSRWNFCHGHDKTAWRFGRDVTGSHFQ